jgi:hypothetical protein
MCNCVPGLVTACAEKCCTAVCTLLSDPALAHLASLPVRRCSLKRVRPVRNAPGTARLSRVLRLSGSPDHRGQRHAASSHKAGIEGVTLKQEARDPLADRRGRGNGRPHRGRRNCILVHPGVEERSTILAHPQSCRRREIPLWVPQRLSLVSAARESLCCFLRQSHSTGAVKTGEMHLCACIQRDQY